MVKFGVLSTLLLGGAIAVAACNSLLGIDAPNVISEEACVLKSDCPDKNHVCLFRVCSPPCLADEDCPEGARCLHSEDGPACVRTDQATCGEQEDCPEGTLCSGGMCRTDCSNDMSVCLRDQICTSSGVCRGTDPDRDPEPGPAELGGACDEPGAIACAGHAEPERLRCEEGAWAAFDSCEEGSLCNNAVEQRGQCTTIPPECSEREANEAFCEGSTRKVCGPDRVTVESTACDTAQHCAQSTTATCAVCLPNEFVCDGSMLRKCNAERTGFEDEKDCADAGAPCSASAGDCTEFACNAGQKRCADDAVEICKADRSGFELDEKCGEGLCDSETFECLACAAGGARCTDAVTRAECSADGRNETIAPCDGSTPYCIGAGNCVECLGQAQCSDTEVCREGACVNAVHTVGWESATASTTAVTGNWIYWQKLPQLTRDAKLVAFGVVGTETLINFKMAIFPDDGSGTQAGSGLLARSATDIMSAASAQETTNITPTSVVLQKNTTYWLAVRADANTQLRSSSSPGLLAFHRDGAMFTHFPADLHDMGEAAAINGTARAIYIRVQDVE